MELTGKQRRYLRSIGQRLSPVVMIGRGGLTGSVMRAVDQALEDHELIKVRVGRECEIERKEAAKQIAERSDSALAQVVGNTMLLYKRRKKDPKIELPKAGAREGGGA